ncbi:MAG: pyridoxal 5'-phosphate synthase glutaminase subunit PdxT [Defluviitaleaceae bacterium]|nr:pyridoxal 5'-phosphate synthase glutaminase subunit PdxT [Defluviitaleaceae bacterium]MCL2262397.1 pyridoxal 5'-phosphate synthase glutaminase subunit PdxT [Defluviitaleaceae bacterium]
MRKKIGVLALQGAFIEHIHMLEKLGATPVEIRQKSDFTPALDGIILPGGESTVMGNLLHKTGLFEPLRNALAEGLPALGTCAGLILMAKNAEDSAHKHLCVLGVTVRRHGFGRQINSFSTEGDFAGQGQVPMVFIRGPYITAVEDGVEILATAQDKIVAVRQKNLLGIAFHPELTGDTTVHEFFLKKVLTND